MELREQAKLTPSPLLNLLGPLDGPGRPLLLLLLGATSVEVLHHHPHEHVEHEEADQEQERNEVEKSPLIIVLPWLEEKVEKKRKK